MRTSFVPVLVFLMCSSFVQSVSAKPKHVFMLMDGSVVKSKPTSGFYVEGIASGTGIRPTSGVEGGKDADLCTSSGQFLLELSTGHVFSPIEGREPIPPYVRGCKPSTKFVPSDREVVCFEGRHQ
jgi:hypothetical protein